MEEMRYAHSDGHTDICFDDSGRYLVTCGNDGDIRIWEGFEDEDPVSHHMGDSVSAVAVKENKLYVASDDFKLKCYLFPDTEFDGIIAEFSSTVYHIVCSKDGNLVAAGGGDFLIKLYNNDSKSLAEFRVHDGPILSLTFDTQGKYLASSSCDGTLRIWLLSDQKCVKSLPIFKKSNDMNPGSSLNRIDWSPDGQFIAVPIDAAISFYQRDTWECKFSFTDNSTTGGLSIVTFSPFGNFIAAAGLDGKMIVWNVEAKSIVSRKMHEKEMAICGLKWSPTGKDLAFCDIEGQMGIYDNPFTSSTEMDATFLANIASTDFQNEENDDEDGENAFDIGAIKASLEPKIFGSAEEMEDISNNISVKNEIDEPKIKIVEAPKPPMQTAFQPTSSPMHLERRYMLWNAVGIVRCYNTEEENSVDVEFHDTSVYHPLHLDNVRNHTMASLSTEALLLASPKLEDCSSKLECLHFGTWDSAKEWIVEMSEEEEIEAITLGEGFAVCVTNKRFVRLFTISGVQCEAFSLPGPVVCCSAQNKQLAIVYHKGIGIESDQCFNLMLVEVKLGGHCIVRDYPLPLSPKSFLCWLGYSDEGHLTIADTCGVVSLFNTRWGVKWTPIANVNQNLKGKSDNYFVIGLSEIKQEIRCILCKGSRYPILLPKPTVSVVSFSLPFCEMTTDKGRLEEENRRYSLTHKCLENLLKEGYEVESEHKSVEKKWMDVLLKLFALATRTDREYRALDIAELMPNPIVIQGAIKYATQRHRIALAERLGEVMNKKLNVCEEEEDEEDFLSMKYDEVEEIRSSPAIPYLNHEEKDTVLRPKPLFRTRNETPKETYEDVEVSSFGIKENGVAENGSLTPKASPMSNPFKAESKLKTKLGASPGGIDEILSSSGKERLISPTIPEKKISFKSRPASKKIEKKTDTKEKSSQFGFKLFLEEKRQEIISQRSSSSSTEVNESELVRTAIKLYKELPASEKQKYAGNTEESCNGTTTVNGTDVNENNPAKDSEKSLTTKMKEKRKEKIDSEEGLPKPKKIKTSQTKLSENSLQKLTQFAFTKTSK
ncbi:WD repeat and HMG-box DNA-binding protein 1-like [Uloborus diversus]|uniref:WD repeat and HMG-box DNA-binding protein 1-like n=1 Tax=Uloborus diversus TaxID=327109 RepID=UPI00240A1872|nr:WD repeat and HMG-box DNA-binding protein 1-like [Uloborus diversus]